MITTHSKFQRDQEVMLHREDGRGFRATIVGAEEINFAVNDYRWLYQLRRSERDYWAWAHSIRPIPPLVQLAEQAE